MIYRRIGLCILWLILLACNKSPAKYTPTAKGLTRSGWKYYAQPDYTRAYKKFKEAYDLDNSYIPEYNGLIWSCLRLDSLDRGLYYTRMVQNRTIDSMDLALQIRAGAMMTAVMADSFMLAINLFAPDQYDWRGFVFQYDTLIIENDIRWSAALSYFYTQDYVKSAQQIQMVRPDWTYNTESSDFISNLLAMLNLIGRQNRLTKPVLSLSEPVMDRKNSPE
ncbi:MAG: hypothetical protein KBA26_05985 [Candidatus Delongbacteria bacterium]|nr:hypothetical protein [Candidatus Delongbacteria bacterium]